MNNLKRVNKILIFTLLIFSIFALASYSKSASKYFQDKDSIVFDTNLVSLYHNTGGDTVSLSIIKDKSDRNKATYLYTFLRNKEAFFEDEINNNIGEEYTIIVDSDCTITSVTSGKKSYDLPSNIKNKYTLKFNDAPQDEEKINVEYSCPVDLNTNDDIETNINIREKIEGDNSDFLYLYYNSKITKEEYRKIIDDKGIVMNYDTITIPGGTLPSEIKDSVRTWLKNYIDEYKTKNKDNKDLASIIVSGGPLSSHDATYNNPLEKYIYEKFGDFSDLNLDLLGLTVTHENDNYVLKLDDKFVGYALTDWHYSDASKVFYFSSSIKNETEINEIFNYYVEKYMATDKDAVYEYFNKIGGIYKFLNGEVKVSPMIMMYSGGRLLFMRNFLKDPRIIEWTETDTITDRRDKFFTTIYNQMQVLWPDEFPLESEDKERFDYMQLLISNTVFATNAIHTKRVGIEFNDYLVLHTDFRDILINVCVENIDGALIARATVDELVDGFTYDSATTISYVTSTINNDNTLKPNILLVEEVTKYSQKLDALNNTDYTASINDTFISVTNQNSGIIRIDNNNSNIHYLLVTFVNSIDETLYNQIKVGSVPDANVASGVAETPDTQEPTPDAPTSTTQNSGTTTTSTPDTQSSTQPTTTTTTTSGKSGNDEGDNTLNPEPNINGAGGDDN